jgi:hypothetical protein
MRFRLKESSFYCFSPPIMVITASIELVALLYVGIFQKRTKIHRTIIAILFFLAIFQIIEFAACESFGPLSGEWLTRIGFISISTLPPLGLHLLHLIYASKKRGLVWAGYGSMMTFISYFLLVPGTFKGHECTGNYVIFQMPSFPTIIYSVYYYSLLLTALVLSYLWFGKLRDSTKARDEYRRNAIVCVATGYLAFLLPTTAVNYLNPTTTNGIPSIMCGFAVFLAVSLLCATRFTKKLH